MLNTILQANEVLLRMSFCSSIQIIFFHIVFMYSQTFHLALIFSLVESFNSVHLAQNPYSRDEYS